MTRRHTSPLDDLEDVFNGLWYVVRKSPDIVAGALIGYLTVAIFQVSLSPILPVAVVTLIVGAYIVRGLYEEGEAVMQARRYRTLAVALLVLILDLVLTA